MAAQHMSPVSGRRFWTHQTLLNWLVESDGLTLSGQGPNKTTFKKWAAGSARKEKSATANEIPFWAPFGFHTHTLI